MLNLVGHQVGPFQLVQVLGRGAMGVVYLAKDSVLRRNVALKLIAKGFEKDHEHHERFLREARAAARLVHPNVVQIYQVGETADIRFIAMEYVEGTSMGDAAKQQGGRLPEQFAMERMREASDALGLAETYGICHRDIKPSNLLLASTGVLKVADFGLAHQAGGGGTIGAASNQVEGTPFYMSPEQWSNLPTTPSADVYSLGCTFFHLLVGSPPYPAGDLLGSLRGHCLDPVPDLRTLLPSLDPRFAELIRLCMAKRPEERPSAKAIAQALDEMLVLRRSVVRLRDRTLPTSDPTRPPQIGDTARPPGSGPRVEGWPPPPSASTFGSTAPAPPPPTERSYREYYGFSDHPFSDIRREEQYWFEGPFATALRTIASAATSGRVSVVQGAAGSGRTFTCQMLECKFEGLQIHLVEPELLFGAGILITLCRQAGVPIDPSASQRFLLEAFLTHVTPPTRPNTTVTLVVDGLEPSDAGTINELSALRRASTRGRVGLVLIGGERLAEDLAARPEAASFSLELEPVTLRPLTQSEMLEYIRFRMSAVGGLGQFELDAASQQLLFARTGGNPKLINVYFHNALTLAALSGEPQIRFKTLRYATKSDSYLTPRTGLALLQNEAKGRA